MKGIHSRFMKALVDLVYNGETEVKQIECEEFINFLKQYRVASEESVSQDNDHLRSKKHCERQIKDNKVTQVNVIKKLEVEIKHQKEALSKFQTTFTRMKEEIYRLRTENKELKNHNTEIIENNKSVESTIVTKKKETETQTEEMKDSKDNTYYGKAKFQFIGCKYFNKGKGCRRGENCWFSHRERIFEETVCHFWSGKCRYADNVCRSKHHGQHREE